MSNNGKNVHFNLPEHNPWLMIHKGIRRVRVDRSLIEGLGNLEKTANYRRISRCPELSACSSFFSPLYRDYEVYSDHVNRPTAANVVAVKGFLGEGVANRNRLAGVDVMIAAPNKSVRLLIEIEERPSSPKKILGDVLARIHCNRFAIRLNGEQQYFSVSSDFELIVAGIVPSSGSRLLKNEPARWSDPQGTITHESLVVVVRTLAHGRVLQGGHAHG